MHNLFCHAVFAYVCDIGASTHFFLQLVSRSIHLIGNPAKRDPPLQSMSPTYKLQVDWITFIIDWNILVHTWVKKNKEKNLLLVEKWDRKDAMRKVNCKMCPKESAFFNLLIFLSLFLIFSFFSFCFMMLFHLLHSYIQCSIPINIHFFRSQISR